MMQNGRSQMVELLMVFGFLFLSNLSAFITIIWLSSRFVLIEFLIWLVFTGIVILMLRRQGLSLVFFENLKRNWMILPFIVFSGITIIWSVYREISMYRWGILLCTLIAGGYVGLRYEIRQIVKFLSVFSVYILLLNIAFVLFLPEIGVMNYYSIQGAWKGIYWHKNHMGLLAAFAAVLFLIEAIYYGRRGERQVYFWGIFYVFSVFVLYQSDSVAAYFVTILLHGMVLLALAWMRFNDRLRWYHYVILGLVIMVASLMVYANVDYVFGVFNRNATLTGRLPMWGHLIDVYFARHPIGGYGFNAFWYIESHRVAMQQAANYPDPIVIADNGFIDIMMNTGYVGLGLFLFFYVGAWWRSIQYMIKDGGIDRLFPVLLMMYVLLANISWSLIFENEGYFLFIMIAVMFSASARNRL